MLHGHSMNAFLATLLDPHASEFKVTHIEMIKGIVGQVRRPLRVHGCQWCCSEPRRNRRVRVVGCLSMAFTWCGPAKLPSCPRHACSKCCATSAPLQPVAASSPHRCPQGFYSVHTVPIIENTARECELTDRLRDAIQR